MGKYLSCICGSDIKELDKPKIKSNKTEEQESSDLSSISIDIELIDRDLFDTFSEEKISDDRDKFIVIE